MLNIRKRRKRRAYAMPRLTAILWRFLDLHEQCVATEVLARLVALLDDDALSALSAARRRGRSALGGVRARTWSRNWSPTQHY
jgi:hypothetical protein